MKISTTHNEYESGTTHTHTCVYDLTTSPKRKAIITAEGDSEIEMTLNAKKQLDDLRKEVQDAEKINDRRLQELKNKLTPCRVSEVLKCEGEDIRQVLVDHERVCRREDLKGLLSRGKVEESEIVFIVERK